MAISTYAELQTELGNWLNRSDLTSQLPEFVELAEARFDREINHHRMYKRSTAPLASQYIDLPDDWIHAVAISIDTTPRQEVQPITIDQYTEWRYKYNTSAQPIFYAIIEDTLAFLPSPDDTYTVEMIYKARLPDLATNSTNWLLDNYPDLYLFASLAEAALYVMDSERHQIWDGRTRDLLQSLRREADRAIVGGTPVARHRSFG